MLETRNREYIYCEIQLYKIKYGSKLYVESQARLSPESHTNAFLGYYSKSWRVVSSRIERYAVNLFKVMVMFVYISDFWASGLVNFPALLAIR